MNDPTNNDRARWANTALSAFALETDPYGVNAESERIQDLLTDLRHLADAHGIDIEDLWRGSAGHYNEETAEGPKADPTALED